MSTEEYVSAHKLEAHISRAFSAAVRDQVDNPLQFIAKALLAQASAPPQARVPALLRSRSTSDELAKALEVAAAGGSTDEERAAMSDEGGWSIEGWVNGIPGSDPEIKLINQLVADAVQEPLGERLSTVSQSELAFIRVIGSSSEPHAIFAELLAKANVEERLAMALGGAAKKLASSSVHTTTGLHSKFAARAGFSVAFGGLSEFHSGLEGLLGAPNPNLLKAMGDEHCHSADSTEPFTSDNYSVYTSSECEWLFVVAPSGPLAPLALARLSLDHTSDGWPQHGRTSADSFVRRPREPSAFDVAREDVNGRLRQLGFEEICIEEQHAGRLYTGPLYVKYNSVLRALTRVPMLVERFERLCAGNQYCTTIHVINSAILKLSRLMTPLRVYRGMAGGMMPPEFFKERKRASVSDALPSLNGVVEFGDAAGADMRWLSQYPQEAEVLFAPLTALEVTGTRVEGDTLLVEIRLSVNMASGTIAEVVARRRKLVSDMCRQMRTDLELQQRTAGAAWDELQRLAGATLDVRAAARELLAEATGEAASGEAAYYNGDQQLSDALLTVVDAKMGMSWPEGLRAVLALLGGVGWADAVARRALVLQNKGLGPKEAGALALVVRASAALEEVDIFGNQKVGPIGVRLLAGALKSRPGGVRSLNLRCCGVGEAGARALAEVLRVEGCALEFLNLEYNQVSEAGVAEVARAASGSRLRELDLKWNDAGDAGAAALAGTLAADGLRLQGLNLLQCSINDAQAVVLAAGVEANVSLTELDLRQNTYGSVGFAALWRAAVACKSLVVCKLDVPAEGVAEDAEQANSAAVARQPPLKLDLAVKARAETGEY